MTPLREDIAMIRRAKREARARLYAKWDEEGVRRPQRWHRLATVAGALLGTYLLVWGDDTVERVLGVGLLAGPALLTVVWTAIWAVALWKLQQSRKT